MHPRLKEPWKDLSTRKETWIKYQYKNLILLIPSILVFRMNIFLAISAVKLSHESRSVTRIKINDHNTYNFKFFQNFATLLYTFTTPFMDFGGLIPILYSFYSTVIICTSMELNLGLNNLK